MSGLTVVIAPDSFKGSASAARAAAAIERGWLRVRPGDRLVLLPQADGGEGTLEALAAADPAYHWHDTPPVTGPDGHPTPGRWLEAPGGDAIVELALVSGLPLMAAPDPLHAHTIGLGEVIRHALAHNRSVTVGLGGSASTDGGAGLLVGLGARLLDASGRPLPPGGAALADLARLDLSGLARPDEVLVLTDVDAPLLGPEGAAAVFGPQKGASEADIAVLEAGLQRWSEVVGVDPGQPGFGAAGGTAYALAAVLGATITPGAPQVARSTGLVDAVAGADVLISGEGRFDATSMQGKVVGHALGLPGPHRRIVIAGEIALEPSGIATWSLGVLAGDPAYALEAPEHWLGLAGEKAAQSVMP
ncbi:glycerate kinase [Ammonicoccus fulvus]|uniref:Glycerate kinase n=1 Tax=Ammonicoccus fulvus TaxID=3138240 RepID=A0ABZ3FRU1_9ACTN